MLRSAITTVSAVLGAVVGVVAVAPAAAAEDDPVLVGNATGGGWVAGTEGGQPPTTAEARVLAAKVEIWEAYDALTSGTISRSEYDAVFTRNAAAAHLAPGDGEPASLRPPPCGDSDDPCPDVALDVPHVGQSTSYYCGPASGVMIARYKDKDRSAHTGARLNQTKMANVAHMHTEETQSTPYASGKFTRGLNKWLYGEDSAGWRYAQIDNPTVRRFKQALRWNITHWTPIGVSTVEWKADGSYNGHHFESANDPIGHWIVGRGFRDHGGRVLLLDPATTVWPAADPRIDLDTSDFVTTYVDNGISAT